MRVDATNPAVAQIVASMGQPMGNNPLTQNVWRSRGAMLLDEIGPAILITHGDGAVFASVTAQERPNLVKDIVAVEPPGGELTLSRLGGVTPVLTAANRDALEPVLQWMETNVNKSATGTASSGIDQHPNRDNTSLKLADQGCFWVGVQRKQMSYGTIAMGQQYVQYMIPAERPGKAV